MSTPSTRSVSGGDTPLSSVSWERPKDYTPIISVAGTPRSVRSVGSTRSKRVRSSPPTIKNTPKHNETPRYIISLVEYRTKRQIGMTVWLQGKPEIHMYQFTDAPTYHSTFRLLNLYDASDILVPDTAQDSVLVHTISEQFQLSSIRPLRRKYFNEENGALKLQSKATPESMAQTNLDSTLYLALATANAMLMYMEFSGTNYAARTISVSMKPLEHFVQIDMESARNLELVASKSPVAKGSYSLFGILNSTKTPMGERMLRSTILQPLRDKAEIEKRFATVEEFLNSQDLFFDTLSILPQFGDIDAMGAHLASLPKTRSELCIQNELANSLRLKHFLESIPALVEPLGACKSSIMIHVVQVLRDESRMEMLDVIGEYLQPEYSILHKKTTAIRLQEQLAYSVKPGLNGMLDVARVTFSELFEEIQEILSGYADGSGISDFKPHFTPTRGFHFSIPRTNNPLPDQFVQVSCRGKRTYCSTEELIKLDDRRKQAFSDIIHLSSVVLQDMVRRLRDNITWLYKLSDGIAHVDLLVSFANYVTLSSSCVKPTISDSGYTLIRDGRHPVLEKIKPIVIPNEAFFTPLSSCQIVRGANGSGKTTFLSEVGILAIMAHIGCYVPASTAMFRTMDHIYAKFASLDTSETDMGAFFKESRQLGLILHHATEDSLVLIDEMGTRTSGIDGVALSWSVIEKLLLKGAYALVSTHQDELLQMTHLYPSRLQVLTFEVTEQDNRLEYLYRGVASSSQRIKHYGVIVATMAGIHPTLISRAMATSDAAYQALSYQDRATGVETRKARLVEQLGGFKHSQKQGTELVQDLRRVMREYEDVFTYLLN